MENCAFFFSISMRQCVYVRAYRCLSILYSNKFFIIALWWTKNKKKTPRPIKYTQRGVLHAAKQLKLPWRVQYENKKKIFVGIFRYVICKIKRITTSTEYKSHGEKIWAPNSHNKLKEFSRRRRAYFLTKYLYPPRHVLTMTIWLCACLIKSLSHITCA